MEPGWGMRVWRHRSMDCAPFWKRKKKITDNFRLDRSGLESSHWLWMLSIPPQRALVNQVSGTLSGKSCYMKQWRVSCFWREGKEPPQWRCDGLNRHVSAGGLTPLVVKLCQCQAVLWRRPRPARSALTLWCSCRSCRRKWFPVVFLSSKRGDRWRCCGRYVAR